MLEIRDVSVRIGGRTVLDRVTLTAASGTITGIIGPNGAGKTTLFNVVTGLRRPTRGQVHLAGDDVTRRTPAWRARAGLARTFQVIQLADTLTVRENVELAVSGGHAVDDLLAFVGVEELAQQPAQDLTTGQGRLVELARALATGPELLLLDEPASGLDDAETEHLVSLLRDIAGAGPGIVLVEHHVPTVMSLCEHVHVLDGGRVIASGPPAQVRADPAVQAAYLGPQDIPAAAGAPA